MKKNYFVLFFTLFSFAFGFSQSDAINYQGIARDSDGDLLTEETIGLTLALKYSASGAAEYSENHSVTTDASGVFSIQIGTGTAISGNYASLDWGLEDVFITTSVNGTEVGTTELNAVPYALASAKATSMQLSDLTDISGTPSSGDLLSFDGTNWTPSSAAGSSLWSENGSSIYRTTGSVGIGTASPDTDYKLHVSGDLFVQSNVGGFNIGYPDGGNVWKFETSGSGANLILRNRVITSVAYLISTFS